MPNFETKPEGMSYADWLKSKNIGMSVKTSTQRRLGTGAPSKLIKSKTGGVDTLVLSEGFLEQEEIDHIEQVSEEREIARQKSPKNKEAQAIDNIVKETLKAPEGKRHETMKKIGVEGLV